jgi:hypothetical protein
LLFRKIPLASPRPPSNGVNRMDGSTVKFESKQTAERTPRSIASVRFLYSSRFRMAARVSEASLVVPLCSRCTSAGFQLDPSLRCCVIYHPETSCSVLYSLHSMSCPYLANWPNIPRRTSPTFLVALASVRSIFVESRASEFYRAII